MWIPHWFSRIACLRKHMLFDATIARNARQYTTTARFARKQYHLAIWREARLLMPSAVRYQLHLPTLKILCRNIKLRISAMY